MEDVYLGAQTQFATLRGETQTRKQFTESDSKLGTYVYFKTSNYQNPTYVVINGRIDTFVEGLDNNEFVVNIDGIDITCFFIRQF